MSTPNDRTKSIGGSDCAAILGMSRFKTPLQVWAEKTGSIVPEDISGKLQVKLGIELEDFVARQFTEETGKKVRRVNETLYHSKHPFLSANIDRRIVGDNEGLECKTTTAFNARAWEGEDIPKEYILQCMHYLAVTGAKRWYIAVLIGNHDFKWKVIERDEKVIQEIISREAAFWTEYIEPKIMPFIITADDSDTLGQLYPSEVLGEPVALDDSVDRTIETINSMYADYKALERDMDKLKNELKAKLGDNMIGESRQWVVTWKSQKSSRLDAQRLRDEQPHIAARYSKETKSRVLRYRPVKEDK